MTPEQLKLWMLPWLQRGTTVGARLTLAAVALVWMVVAIMTDGHWIGTLVAFGNGGRVQEFDQSGAIVWEIHGSPGYIFRAQRIGSLYQPGVGWGR